MYLYTTKAPADVRASTGAITEGMRLPTMTATSIARRAHDDIRDRMQADIDRALNLRTIYDVPASVDRAYPCPDVRTVEDTFLFQPYDFGTWIDPATGRQVLSTMAVTSPADPTSRFLVTLDLRGEFPEWRCKAPSFRQHWAATMITAVQKRVAKNRAARMMAN
jgi:hypothetical protein